MGVGGKFKEKGDIWFRITCFSYGKQASGRKTQLDKNIYDRGTGIFASFKIHADKLAKGVYFRTNALLA